MKPKKPLMIFADFTSVLSDGDDQAMVRYLLIKHVPKEVKEKVVAEYNTYIDSLNQYRQTLRQEFMEASHILIDEICARRKRKGKRKGGKK